MDILDLIHDDSEALGKVHRCTARDCPKAFTRKSDLGRHQRVHQNERPFDCKHPDCGKSFIQKSALTVHMRTHTGEKPHECEEPSCGRTFSDISSLARHRRIHRGKNPYICKADKCGRRFRKKRTLTTHVKARHGEAAKSLLSASLNGHSSGMAEKIAYRKARNNLTENHSSNEKSTSIPLFRLMRTDKWTQEDPTNSPCAETGSASLSIMDHETSDLPSDASMTHGSSEERDIIDTPSFNVSRSSSANTPSNPQCSAFGSLLRSIGVTSSICGSPLYGLPLAIFRDYQSDYDADSCL